MDYLLVALAAFSCGVFVHAWMRRTQRRRAEGRRRDASARQADAFLRGIKAFERGVATQVERDRRAARLRRLMGQRPRVL
ncbi:MAG TPA: hypothetical protein VLL50_08710 [Usitatibacter sp.]|nr:hypothetical protein [Usitatibacter sp.]